MAVVWSTDSLRGVRQGITRACCFTLKDHPAVQRIFKINEAGKKSRPRN